MAHSRKRKRGCVDNNIKELKLDDVMCPVCRSIVIEPVSLPCKLHILCHFCFEKTIENNTLTCPICRKRIGSWLRSATKSRSLINSKLWLEIQKRFPEQVKNKLRGEDDGVEEEVITATSNLSKIVSNPGEIKQEFEEQMRKYSDELTREKIEEEKASVEYINKLLEVEINEDLERRKELMKVIEKDENLARSLQLPTEINLPVPETIPHDKKTSKVTKVNSTNKKTKLQKTCKVTIEKYFGVQPSRISSSRSSISSTSDSRNSIDVEFSHFKPIIREPKTPPKKMSDGSVLDLKPRRIQPLNLELSGKFDVPTPNVIGPNILHSDGPKAFSPIKPNVFLGAVTVINQNINKDDNSDDSDTDFENNASAEFSSVPSTSSTISVQQPSVTCDASVKFYSVLEKELRLRLQQEEQDRKFAEYLQNIWDTENQQLKEKSRSDYELRSRPSNARSTTSTVTSVGRQTTLDKHVQPVTM